LPATAKADDAVLECWYFFPEGPDKAVMMRGIRCDKQGAPLYCQWLQTGRANYFFDNSRNVLFTNNYHVWARDLSVWRLPTDGPEMTEFLSQTESVANAWTDCVVSRDSGLLAIAMNGPEQDYTLMQVVGHRNLLSEDYFRFDWPAGVEIVDNRDEMHKRGWTYFRVEGEIAGRPVRGTGRLPFLYTAGRRHYPWLRLQIGDDQFADAGDGRLFEGLGRPWMGLHTIDTIRRDAARQHVIFDTKLAPDQATAMVTLTTGKTSLLYTIDMEKDVVDKIAFSGDVAGELRFSYLQDIDNMNGDFQAPRTSRYGLVGDSQGMGWLIDLAEKIKNENR
jgi:hypothetical protein